MLNLALALFVSAGFLHLSAPKSRDSLRLRRRFFGPDIMQSGFGLKFLFWSGEF